MTSMGPGPERFECHGFNSQRYVDWWREHEDLVDRVIAGVFTDAGKPELASVHAESVKRSFAWRYGSDDSDGYLRVSAYVNGWVDGVVGIRWPVGDDPQP